MSSFIFCVLCCIVLCCAVLGCVVLCYVTLGSVVLCVCRECVLCYIFFFLVCSFFLSGGLRRSGRAARGVRGLPEGSGPQGRPPGPLEGHRSQGKLDKKYPPPPTVLSVMVSYEKQCHAKREKTPGTDCTGTTKRKPPLFFVFSALFNYCHSVTLNKP